MTTRRLKGIIFDIDGTLIDSNDHHAAAWQEAFSHFDRDFSYDLVRSQIGKGGDLLVPDLLQARDLQRFGEELREYRKRIFKKKYMEKIRPFEGIRELFESLRSDGFRLILASSAAPDEVEYYSRLVGIEKLLEGSTSAEDAELSKPSPEIFQAALEQLGTEVSDTITVGDTPYDVLASHRATLPIIAVRSGGFPEEQLEKAEFLFDRATAIPEKMPEIEEYFRQLQEDH